MGMQLVETIEVGSGGAASIEFTGIPSTGVDLLLLLSLRTDVAGSAGDGADLIFNADSGSNYPVRELRGENGSVTTSAATASSISSVATGAGATANTFANTQIYISNYTASQNKSVSVDNVTENNSADTNLRIRAAQWSDTSAITSIGISCSPADFVQYSSASLYIIS